MLSPAATEIVYEAKTRFIRHDKTVIAEKIHKLTTGMTLEEISELVEFIEVLRLAGRHTTDYLRKENTHLARTIEIDPLGDRIFIHLKTHNVPRVGKGAHKHVTYSILYDPLEPKLVATAIVADTATTQTEIELLQKLRGSEGIIEPLYITPHTKKDGKVLYEIISPLYNKGSLRSYIRSNPFTIPFEVKLKIAKDILIGACFLNSMGYVSGDNNRGNFFVQEENDEHRCVLGDLGGYTRETHVALQKRPFGPSARSGAPDLQRAYHENRLTEDDLYSNHVYSLGRVFHFLYFEQEVPWINTFNQNYPLLTTLYKDRSNPEILPQIERIIEEISLYTKPRLQELADMIEQGTAGPEEHFEFVLFTMLSTDPKARKSNSYWLWYINNHF